MDALDGSVWRAKRKNEEATAFFIPDRSRDKRWHGVHQSVDEYGAFHKRRPEMIENDFFEQHWVEIKNSIRRRWGKFDAKDLDAIKGNIDRLVGRIQSVYGCARAQAEIEYHEFQVSLRPLLQPEVVAPSVAFTGRYKSQQVR